jgi:hypothetical protein
MTLTQLIDAGMSVARFNFSHGDHEGHKACLDRLRQAAAIKRKHVGTSNETIGDCIARRSSIVIFRRLRICNLPSIRSVGHFYFVQLSFSIRKVLKLEQASLLMARKRLISSKIKNLS